MGNNVSSVTGVKSPNFYEQGNGINEIWVKDLEVVSRLPFGDSDLGQAGWPVGGWPKIPWHQFIIPLKRDLAGNIQNNFNETMEYAEMDYCIPQDNACHCLPKFTEVGYMGMYHNWDIKHAAWFSTILMLAGHVTLYLLQNSMQWNVVCLKLHALYPSPAEYSTYLDCLRTGRLDPPTGRLDPPNRIPRWRHLKSWLWRFCLRKFLMLVFGTICVVFAIPGLAFAFKAYTGPQVLVIILVYVACMLGQLAVMVFGRLMAEFYWHFRFEKWTDSVDPEVEGAVAVESSQHPTVTPLVVLVDNNTLPTNTNTQEAKAEL
ncbi:hypothetical protein N7466_003814 [Penicillium verhagenii]|uniref:uncharacterized protein n=1 Tax=Penicillium verhagenii TaxID=1562060 RepID=UPI002545BD57|nr:uncharacterized protein N7466_003814 [Penicillium verhagenii]KAJ5934267.1 hypothetical protein N7466_003814 [Penicillium verhagenii]